MSIWDKFCGRRAFHPTGLIPPPSAYHEESVKLAREQANWYQAKLYEAWRTMAGQTRGLQRQRRIINRLRAEIAELKAARSTGNPAP